MRYVRRSLAAWAAWMLTLVAVPQEVGVSVRLQDWGLSEAALIRRGELVFEEPGGGGYVSELRGSSDPTPPEPPPLPPVAVEEQRCYAAPGAHIAWEGRRLQWDQQTATHLGGTLRLREASPYRPSELALWLRGRGRVDIALADPQWQAREDAVPVATIELGERWQLCRLTIPQPGLDPERLTLLRFGVQQQGWLEWSSLAWAEPWKATTAPPSDTPWPVQSANACWIWDSEARLEGDREWILFLKSQRVGLVFLQQPRQLDGRLQALIGELHAAGMEVHALNGDRHDVLPESRPAVLEQLQRLAQFQRESPPLARFDGLHYDVEPYLLPGFPHRKSTVLQQYVALVETLVAEGHRLNLPVLFDLPFWFDQPVVSVAGLRASVLEHVLDRADGVALMSYRTNAQEVLDCTARSRGWARSRGKPCWVSLETVPLPDERSYTFEGVPRLASPSADEVVYDQGQFWLGPSTRRGLCWKLGPARKQSADRISFARLPRATFETVRQTLLGQSPLAIHDLAHWLRMVRP